MKAISIVVAVVVTASAHSASFAAETISYWDLVSRLTDLERLATPIVEGEKTFASTSHDRGMSYDPQTDTYRRWSANGDGGGCIRRRSPRRP